MRQDGVLFHTLTSGTPTCSSGGVLRKILHPYPSNYDSIYYWQKGQRGHPLLSVFQYHGAKQLGNRGAKQPVLLGTSPCSIFSKGNYRIIAQSPV